MASPTTTKPLKDSLYSHVEEIDEETNSASSGSSEHLQNYSNPLNIEEKKNGTLTTSNGLSAQHQMTEEKSQQEHKKTNSLRRLLKKEGKHTELEKTAQEEKKSEGLVRVISGIFTHKSKSEEKRKDDADNKRRRHSSKQSNVNSETKSGNRHSYIFASDNEDEIMKQQTRRNKRANSNDFPHSDNEGGKSKNIKQKNRLSLNLDKFLRHDDHKHKNFNNDITDMFLPEINGSPIRTKGRLDSSGSKRTPIVTVLDSSYQTESPSSFTPGVNSFSVINESVHKNLPEIKVGSIEEQTEEEIGYSSANSINENRSINEQQQKSRPISQVSSSSINSEKYEPNANYDFKHYNNQPEVEVNGDFKSDTNINDEVIDNIKVTDTNEDLKSSTVFSHNQEESLKVTAALPTPPKTPGFVGEEIQHDYLNRDIEQDRKLENNIVRNGQVYHVEETPQIMPPVSQDTVITQETPQIHQKFEQIQATNESLNNIKNQLESKVDEQSQQISKLSSLESIVVRQLELAERMEETMRRLETKVNQQKEEIDGLLAGRMEDTIKRLEYKLNEQNKELEGLKLVIGQLQTTNPHQLLLTADPEAQFSTSSTTMTMTTQQNHPMYSKDTLVHTLVVKPLVNTIVFSAGIATSVLYAVYVRPVVGLVKVVRG